VRNESFGKIQVAVRQDNASSVSSTVSFASGHVALNAKKTDRPIRAPPICEKLRVTPRPLPQPATP